MTDRAHRARAVGAVRRALDHHRRMISYTTGVGAECACGESFADAEAWKKHQAREAERAAEGALTAGGETAS